MLARTPELDFLYYSNDMIGAGGMLYLLEKGVDIPGEIGLAGFNGVELLDGLPRRLATMDATAPRSDAPRRRSSRPLSRRLTPRSTGSWN